jgi:hypothetical protein
LYLNKLPFKKSEGSYYKTNDASKFLGIPESLLGFLKTEKSYTLKRLAFGLDGYSELDLIEFRDGLLNKASNFIEFDSANHITMKKIVLKRPLGTEAKGEFIKSVLSNTILPIGHIGRAIGDLVFDRNETLDFLDSIKTI